MKPLMGRSIAEVFGVKPGQPAPEPPPFRVCPDPPLLHPERLTDPRWAWKRRMRGTYVDFLRRNGWLDEARLAAHFKNAACDRRPEVGPTVSAPDTGPATSVGTPGYRPGSTPNPPPTLGSQPQAAAIG